MFNLTKISSRAIGVLLNLQVLEDGQPLPISSATVKQIRLIAPSGKIKSFPADFKTDGSDGRLVYTTISTNDISETGEYLMRAYLEMDGYLGQTNPVDGFIAV